MVVTTSVTVLTVSRRALRRNLPCSPAHRHRHCMASEHASPLRFGVLLQSVACGSPARGGGGRGMLAGPQPGSRVGRRAGGSATSAGLFRGPVCARARPQSRGSTDHHRRPRGTGERPRSATSLSVAAALRTLRLVPAGGLPARANGACAPIGRLEAPTAPSRSAPSRQRKRPPRSATDDGTPRDCRSS